MSLAVPGLTMGGMGLTGGGDRSLFLFTRNNRSVSSPLTEQGFVCLYTQIPVLALSEAIAGMRMGSSGTRQRCARPLYSPILPYNYRDSRRSAILPPSIDHYKTETCLLGVVHHVKYTKDMWEGTSLPTNQIQI